MTPPTIRTATAAEAEPTIAALVLAFSADPSVRWAYPEPPQYLSHYPHFVRAFGGQAFAHQSAYYLEGYVGAALWLPPAVHPDEAAVIVGGESGPRARPLHPDWVRSLREQCHWTGVPFFFKPWGGANKKQARRLLEGRLEAAFPVEEPA